MNAAQLGAEAKPHSEGCRERVRQALMNCDMGQQEVAGGGAASCNDRRAGVRCYKMR